jgi:hypothetical protein
VRCCASCFLVLLPDVTWQTILTSLPATHNTHRLAPAAGQPGAGVREGRHACDEPGPAVGAGGGGAAQVAAHSGNAVKPVPTLLRTYLLAELSVEQNGCAARRTVLCDFI